MTMDLDSGIMPLSSIGTVTNTVVYKNNNVHFKIFYYDADGQYKGLTTYPTYSNGRFHVSYTLPAGCYADNFEIIVTSSGLPNSGSYNFSFDLSSDFAHSYRSFLMITRKNYTNADFVRPEYSVTDRMVQSSGDLFLPPFNVYVNSSCQYMLLKLNLTKGQNVRTFSGSFAFHFESVPATADIVNFAGVNSMSDDYSNNVSSSLSDLSSSVGSMTEDLSSAAESLEYISQSQNH